MDIRLHLGCGAASGTWGGAINRGCLCIHAKSSGESSRWCVAGVARRRCAPRSASPLIQLPQHAASEPLPQPLGTAIITMDLYIITRGLPAAVRCM